MARIKFIFFILTLVIVGCSSQAMKDFEYSDIEKVTLERSGMFTIAEYALQNITIDEAGLLYETFYYNGTKSSQAYTKFNSDEYQRFLNVLQDNNALDLKDEYFSSIQVADIGEGKITLWSRSSSKSIDINPYIQEGNPTQVINIIEEMYSITSKANSPFSYVISMKYQGMQCIEEPWEIWYSQGNIQFIKAPTTKELISAYYSSKGVDIQNLREFENGDVCLACDICPDNYYYEIEVPSYSQKQLIKENWILN